MERRGWLPIKRAVALLRPPRRPGCTRDTTRCDFWNWGPDAIRPPCCTAHLTELTSFVHELLERRGVTHWLDYGTLLGAVREGQFIAWDEDADFGVLEGDVARILALEPEVAAAGYVLDDTTQPGVVRVQFSELNAQHVDLFVWRDDDGELRSDFSSSYDWPGLHNRAGFPRTFIEPLDAIPLGGRLYPAPSPFHEFLVEHRYGPDYMTPERSAVSPWLLPDLAPDDMTPHVKRLVEAVSERDRRLAELNYGSRLSRTRPWQAWRNAGRPLRPSSDDLARAGEGIATDDRSETVHQLIYALASLNSAIDELEHPRRGDSVRRSYRRGVHAWRVLVAKLTGEPRQVFGHI